MRVAALLVAVGAGCSLLLGPAAASPPPAGVLVPGKSLGGLRLGMTPAAVRSAWGSSFGRCRNCAHTTWYYNYAPFTPQGAGVQFRSGRVVAIFTLRSPVGWHTTKRLRIGDPQARVTELYGALPQVHCSGYDALTILAPRATTIFYVQDAKVFGFGLSRAAVPACR